MKTTYSKLLHSKLNYFSDIQQLWFLSQKTTLEMKFQFTHSVLSDSLQRHGLQQVRLPCLSPTPRACSNSCPSSQWCLPTISSSVIPFSSYLLSFPASGSFPMSRFFISGGQSIGIQLQHQSFQWIFRVDFLLGELLTVRDPGVLGKVFVEELERNDVQAAHWCHQPVPSQP